MLKDKKNLFLSIVVFAFLIISVLISFSTYTLLFNKENLFKYFFAAITVIIVFIGLFIFVGVFSAVMVIYGKSRNKYLIIIFSALIDIIYPFAIFWGKIFRIKRDKVQQSYIELKNFLFNEKLHKYKPQEILILAPHCIQYSECKFKVTNDIYNCKRCGKCQINDLVNLKDKYGVNVAIATGGTLARKIVRDVRPKVIIAIACERDLTSGMQDVKQIPVYGIINERPFGSCFNTRVNIEEVENTIIKLLNGI